jgi:hypothetical protein
MKKPTAASSTISTLGTIAGAALAVALSPGAGAAGTVSFARIADPTTAVRPVGYRPALENGVVLFLGTNATTLQRGVYLAPADGTGPFTLVADESVEVPNQPGELFDNLDDGAVYGGVAYFTGGSTIQVNDGVYTGSGGPVTTSSDVRGFAPSAGPLGVAFRTDQSAAQFPSPWFQPHDGPLVHIIGAGDPLPNGDQFTDVGIGETRPWGTTRSSSARTPSRATGSSATTSSRQRSAPSPTGGRSNRVRGNPSTSSPPPTPTANPSCSRAVPDTSGSADIRVST